MPDKAGTSRDKGGRSRNKQGQGRIKKSRKRGKQQVSKRMKNIDVETILSSFIVYPMVKVIIWVLNALKTKFVYNHLHCKKIMHHIL